MINLKNDWKLPEWGCPPKYIVARVEKYVTKKVVCRCEPKARRTSKTPHFHHWAPSQIKGGKKWIFRAFAGTTKRHAPSFNQSDFVVSVF